MAIGEGFLSMWFQALAPALVLALLQPAAPGVHRLSFPVPGLDPMPYALSVPAGYDGREPRPLILALHPGGQRTRYYGGAFAEQIVQPALGELGAIIVAPDCPTRAWSDPIAERAVMALVRSVMQEYAVDRSRILVTGFSLGGRGTWFFASRHADVFTAAITMAGSPGEEPVERLARIPTYVIHSRDDDVVPFAPSERVVQELEKLGRPVGFQFLDGVGHFQMGAYIRPLAQAGRWVVERWGR
jgi:predicted peptidase